MLLVPDYGTFKVNLWTNPDGSKVARMICDVYLPDGSPFAGCPRMMLKCQVERAKEMGYSMVAGPEAEFFLFQKDAQGNVKVETHDVGDYFDLTPVDNPTCIRGSRSGIWASTRIGRSARAAARWLGAGASLSGEGLGPGSGGSLPLLA